MDNKVVFLDRDGVVNLCAPPHEYICDWRDFRFLPRVFEAIRLLNESDYLVVIVTNQRCVARGMITMEALEAIHMRMQAELLKQGSLINAIYVCPHEKGSCKCRKPETGLFLRAEKDFGVDRSASWMIGDSESDILAGKAYGVKTILIGHKDFGQDFSCADLLSAAQIVTGGKI